MTNQCNTEACVESIEKAAQQAGLKFRSCAERTAHDMRGAKDAAASQIRKEPLKSAALAAGIGFLLGKLLQR